MQFKATKFKKLRTKSIFQRKRNASNLILHPKYLQNRLKMSSFRLKCFENCEGKSIKANENQTLNEISVKICHFWREFFVADILVNSDKLNVQKVVNSCQMFRQWREKIVKMKEKAMKSYKPCQMTVFNFSASDIQLIFNGRWRIAETVVKRR